MKARELREKSSEELAENLSEAKKRLFFQMKMQRVTGEGAKPHEVRQLRRDIARIHTILRERQLAGREAGGRQVEGKTPDALDTGLRVRQIAFRLGAQALGEPALPRKGVLGALGLTVEPGLRHIAPGPGTLSSRVAAGLALGGEAESPIGAR